MAQKFKARDKVRQIVTAPITGEVAKFAFSEETGEIQFLVAWKDDAGVVHSRYFGEDQIELVPAAEDAAPDSAGEK